MKNKIIFFFIAFIIWMLLTEPFDWQNGLVGLFVSLLVTYLTSDLLIKRSQVLKNPSRYLMFLYFILVFIWECFKANIDVAYRVIHPGLPIKPGIVKVKTKLKSDLGLTFLANSITLTPGTMCIDIDKENGFMYIHWIYVQETDIEKATRRIVYTFERILEKIFR